VPAEDLDADRTAKVVVTTPAKLTRRLRIVGRREDGLHLLSAEMVTVSLYDEIEFSAGDSFEVVDAVDWVSALVLERGLSGRPGGSSAVTGAPPAVDGTNLVQLALRAVKRSASVRLTKRIPAGAGLGGGSANAAGVLRWAQSSDVGVAAALGADVPFCLMGGRAHVSGAGEIVEPLVDEPASFLLVVPQLHVSTPAVYAAWDALGGPAGELDNDLEPAALEVEPRLVWWRDLVARVSGQRPRLAGSGGTWWLDGDDAELSTMAQAISDAVADAGASALVTVVSATPAS
jgi:4-diphosphocytidyl-2-C-methyl-D-erythritol kinase